MKTLFAIFLFALPFTAQAQQDAAVAFLPPGPAPAEAAPLPGMIPVQPLAAQTPVPMAEQPVNVVVPSLDLKQELQDAAEIASGAQKVADDWGSLGWIVGVMTLVNLLIRILRMSTVETILEEHDAKWLKPWISMILGAAIGGLTVYATGKGVGYSLVSGFMSGVSAVGQHELMNPRKKTAGQNVVENAMTLNPPPG